MRVRQLFFYTGGRMWYTISCKAISRRTLSCAVPRYFFRRTMKPDYKLVAKAKYIHMTADLASEVWHEVYKRYFPAKQLDALVGQPAERRRNRRGHRQRCELLPRLPRQQPHRLLRMEDGEHFAPSAPPLPQARIPRQGHRRDIVASCERWPGARAGAASGAASTHRPCRCKAVLQGRGYRPSALPRVRAASSATS